MASQMNMRIHPAPELNPKRAVTVFDAVGGAGGFGGASRAGRAGAVSAVNGSGGADQVSGAGGIGVGWLGRGGLA